MPTEDYDDFLLEELRDTETAAEYLSASIESGSMDEFLVALRNVANAHRGIGVLSEITTLNRQSMYKMLSAEGNPTLGSLLTVLKAIGLTLTVKPVEQEIA
ncbi:MAG: putative addiction module antidote protein [Leptolyngbyaceae cyanobacterium MO_188.B28]|nr:putative addiction module antidote protein [Leptolyngbyaceae cyanobacterium MO_188.B28]